MARSSTVFLHLKPSAALLRRHFPAKPSTQPFFSRFFSEQQTPTPKRNTKVNFSLSDSESEDDDHRQSPPPPPPAVKPVDKSKLPPPYNPFNKTPVIEEPEDPTNLQEVFHKIRTDGLHNNAVKMFDALSKDGLTHEALELFSEIKDKGQMPEVVAHTAVIEAYAAAGKPKEALKVYLRMLALGVRPNAYTYGVLIRSLAGSGERKLVAESKRCFVEMMEKGIRPNPGVCVAVFEGIVKEEKEEEGRELVTKMKDLGFAPDEKGLREVLKNKRGPVFRSVMNILLAK